MAEELVTMPRTSTSPTAGRTIRSLGECDTLKNYWRVMALAFVGLALVGAGLSLSVLSNPKRFGLSVAEDRSIQFFALSGFGCTLVGIGLFLFAVSRTTDSMPAQLKRNANVGVGLGFVLQLSGLFLPYIGHVPLGIGLAITLLGFPAFVWGCDELRAGKKTFTMVWRVRFVRYSRVHRLGGAATSRPQPVTQ